MVGCVAFMLHQIVYGRKIEIHLPGIFGRELLHLQVDDNKAAQLEMVKQQVEIKVVLAYHEMDLPTYKREAGPQFEQKLLDVRDQPGFEVAFHGFFVSVRKSKRYGSLSDCCARSDWAGGRRVEKLVTAWPWRPNRPVSICTVRTARLQPCSRALAAYQRRCSAALTFWISTTLCPQGSRATGSGGPVVGRLSHGLCDFWPLRLSHRLCDHFRRPVSEIERPHSEHVAA